MTNRLCLSWLLLALPICGCDRGSNLFAIRDPDARVRSAELRLCGQHRALQRVDDVLIGSMSNSCEGSGVIHLHLKDGREMGCKVGYVAAGLEQTFVYTVAEDGCQSALFSA